MALIHAKNHKTVAYIDPFDNLRTQSQKPDLVLKPYSQEQAIAMGVEMLKTKIVDLVMIDSLFLLPSEEIYFEESLSKLVKAAEKYAKPVFLLNPDNQVRKLLEKNLKSFCSSQFRISEPYY